MANGPRLEITCRRRVGELRLEVDWHSEPVMTAIIGPSGAGKTQLLHLVAGLERPDDGVIRWAGRVFDDVAARRHTPPQHRRLSVVFQHSRLFPHLSVLENLVYARRAHPDSQRFADVVDELGLALLLARRPGTLSGGERQRVALGRALLAEPELLLLDEPVSALDLATRLRFMGYLARLHERFAVPVVFVSHDPELVRHFATDAVLLVDGRVTAFGPPAAVLATGLGGLSQGATNLLPGEVVEDAPEGAIIAAQSTRIRVSHTGLAVASPVWVRIPASDLLLMRGAPEKLSARNVFAGRVTAIERHGDRASVTVEAGVRWLVEVLPTTVESMGLELGQSLDVVAKATSFQVFRR